MANDVQLPGTGVFVRSWQLTSSEQVQTFRLDVGTSSTEMLVSTGNPLPVSATSLPLPSGAATAAKQPAFGVAGSASTEVITVQGIASGTAQPISAASLPLPANAATDAKQDTGNTSLASIDGKITAVNTGAVVVASGSITANAGTNLNTSALALEAGNLATLTNALTSALSTQETLTAGRKGLPAFGAVTLNAPSYASSNLDALSLDTAGLLRMSLKDTPANTNKFLVTPDAVPLTTSTAEIGNVKNTGTFAVQASQATATNLKAQAEAYQGGAAVSASNPLFVVLGATSTSEIGNVKNTGTFAVQATLQTGSNVVGVVTGGTSTAEIGNVKNSGTFAVQATLQAGSALAGYVGGKNTYSGYTALTVANFTGLGNSTGWQSCGIALSGSKDAHLLVQTRGKASGTNYLDFYVAESLSTGTSYTDNATGTEGIFNLANRTNSRYLGSVKCNASSCATAAFKLSDIYATLPTTIALIALNNSGAALDTTTSTSAPTHILGIELVN